MGILSKLKPHSSTSDAASTMTESSSAPLAFSNSSDDPSAGISSSSPPHKKSLYGRFQEYKRGPGTSNMTDEEFFKATGKTREEFKSWSETTPGVAGGQAAGSLTAGGNSGIGTSFGAGEGLGGWGYEAGKVPKERLAKDGKDEKDDGVIH